MVKFEDMYKKILFILLFSGGVNLLHASNIEPVNECLVRLNGSIEDFYQEQREQIDTYKLVSKTLNVYLIRLTHTYQEVYALWSTHPEVLYIGRNKKSERRLIPNDPLYINQYHLSKIGMESAWDLRREGLTHNNDTIVIAIIDDGVDVSHPELKENHFINYGEIPGDTIDNDSNGYIDDYEGWNAVQQTNEIFDPVEKARHGTPIAGIIAAKGNNGYGVAGVNWNIKYMVVVGGIFTADILESFDYVLQMKKLYVESNGVKGAYVVTTSSSWGRDYGKEEDEEMWCAMYDSLGKYGIINIAATTNGNTDVDVQGDLPADCSSPYLVTVANVSNKEEIIGGYGLMNIDLAAYGSNCYTTASWVDTTGTNSWFRTFSGTSAATPYVAGAVGVLYANACQSFLNLHDRNPDSAALLTKKFILEGVTKSPFLTNKVNSGGVLNVQTMLQKMEQWCSNHVTPIKETKRLPFLLFPNPSSGQFQWSNSVQQTGVIQVFSSLGQLVLEQKVDGGQCTLDLSNQKNGMYVVQFSTLDGTVVQRSKCILSH